MIVELLESKLCNWNRCLWIHEEICGYVGVLKEFCEFDEMSYVVVLNA
jgi:hypothetical protein